MRDYRQLEVWQRAHQITLTVYKATASFPREEMYGMTSQIRRCSASVGANIAEGCGRRSNPDFHRFLLIASGSASELDYHLLLSRDLKFLSNTAYSQISAELARLRRQLTSLIVKVGGERQQPHSNDQ